MNKKFPEYFDFYLKNLKPNKNTKSDLDSALELIIKTKNSNKKLIIIGNGVVQLWQAMYQSILQKL